jgi:hypothetical protein
MWPEVAPCLVSDTVGLFLVREIFPPSGADA